MRTTIDIPDAMYRRLKARAAREGRSVSDLPGDVRFSFCRFTQLGVLRLLTAEAVMGDEVLSQKKAWVPSDRIDLGGLTYQLTFQFRF